MAKPRDPPLHSIAHCGISIIATLLNPENSVPLPISGDSYETVKTCLRVLKNYADTELVDGFLARNVPKVSKALDAFPVDDWDRLVILASTLSRDKWIENGF